MVLESLSESFAKFYKSGSSLVACPKHESLELITGCFFQSHWLFQPKGPGQSMLFLIESCSNPEFVPARGLFQEGFCSSYGLVPAKGVSQRVVQAHSF